MVAEQWSRVLAASVAPVVVVSACALLSLAFYNRLAAIISRIRAVQRERMDVHQRLADISTAEIEHYSALRETCIMESLAEQTARMRRRARLIRLTLLCLMGAIAAVVLSALLNGLTVFLPVAAVAAAATFLLGMALLLAGVVCAGMELLIALGPTDLESDVVSELTGFGSERGPSYETNQRPGRSAAFAPRA